MQCGDPGSQDESWTKRSALCRGTAVSAVSVALLLAFPSAAHAQAFFELGGGWNYLPPAPDEGTRVHSFNARASVGWRLAPRFRLRIDAFTSQFSFRGQYIPPCVFSCFAGGGDYYVTDPVGVVGLTANGLLNVDPGGILYVIGGVGFYDAFITSRWPARPGLRLGASAGAGIAVPIRGRLRGFVEARYHTFSVTTDPSWMLPITVGLRF
jgi:hypothetical protein